MNSRNEMKCDMCGELIAYVSDDKQVLVSDTKGRTTVPICFWCFRCVDEEREIIDWPFVGQA